MLLAAILSFLVNGKFQGKKYVAIMITITLLISFFSAFGWIEVSQRMSYTGINCYIRPIFPIPLSFPFFAYVERARYDLFFFVWRINREYTHIFLASRGFLYYSLFLLVNIIGSIIGYWINKTRFVERIHKERERLEEHKDHLDLHKGNG